MRTDRTVHRTDGRGTILDWLVTPAWHTDADDLDRVVAAGGDPFVDDPEAGLLGRWVLTNGPDVARCKEMLHRHHRLDGSPAVGNPVVGGEVQLAGHRGRWNRVHCAEDGLVDWSDFCFTPQYRLAAATAVLEVDQSDVRTIRIASTGPWQAFLDDELIAESDLVTYMEPAEVAVQVRLPSGISRLQVVLWQVALRECRHILRVRIGGLPVLVVVPQDGADEFASARAEPLLDAVGLTRWGATERAALLAGPRGLQLECRLGGQTRTVQLGESDTEVLFDQLPEPRDPLPIDTDSTGALAVRPHRLEALEVGLAQGESVPLRRTFGICQLPPRQRSRPEGTAEQWRREFLEHAGILGGVGGGLARWALDPDTVVTGADVAAALTMVTGRYDCADFEAVGLVHLLRRVPAAQWQPGLREKVLESLRGLKYWIDEPGLDAMCYFTENHQLVWHTAELLVAELVTEESGAQTRFGNDGRTAAEHAAHGREMAAEWLHAKLTGGFAEFDSNAYLAIDALALVSLVEFATDSGLVELAAGLADRVLLSLAANSWRGSHGSAHGRSYVPTLRSSRLEETAPIQWLLFGVGALNEQVLPASVLATAHRYQLPEIARHLARAAGEGRSGTGTEEPYWASQSFRGRYRFRRDLLSRPYGSDTVIHRRASVMLASAQDYRYGLPGLQEHIWAATLGPECQVFVTHPPNASVSSASRPNAWAGNRILPRVRQHQELLLALYRLPVDDPMGTTHGWFPTRHLSTYRLAGDWIVGAGEDGNGYVALGTPGGIALVESGPNAYAEVRPARPEPWAADRSSLHRWACLVGDSARNGTFEDFVAALPRLGTPPDGVEVEHGGRQHLLTWSGPFLVDGNCPDLNEDGLLDDPEALTGPWFDTGTGSDTETLGFHVGTAAKDSHRINLATGRSVPMAEPPSEEPG